MTLLLTVLFLQTPVRGEQVDTKITPTLVKKQEQINIAAKIKAEKYIPPPPKPQVVQAVNYPIVPSNKTQIIKAIQTRFGTDPRILTLVNCESGFNSQAVSPIDNNGYQNSGLFQINLVHGGSAEYWFDIQRNINKAWELSNGGTNWSPWPTCKYTAGLA